MLNIIKSKEKNKSEYIKNLFMLNYKNLAVNIFEWKNLPKGLTGEYIEKKLYEGGKLFFYKSKDKGFLCLPAGNSSMLNVYEYPTKVTVQGFNFNETVDYEKGVMLKNNTLAVPSVFMVDFWVDNMVDIFGAFTVNLNHSKTPFLLAGSKDQKLSMENLMKQVTENTKAVFVDKTLSDLASVNLTNTNPVFLGTEFLDTYDRVEDKLLTFLGINNTNTVKKERLVVDEANANNDEIENYLDTFLSARTLAVEKINEMFNLDIEVIVNEKYKNRYIDNDIVIDNDSDSENEEVKENE